MLGSVRFEFGSDLPDANLNFLYSFRKQARQGAFGTIESVPQIMNMSTQNEMIYIHIKQARIKSLSQLNLRKTKNAKT